MNINRKTIFLFDGVGAIVSTFLHGVILPMLSSYIGLPKSIHYILAIFPLVYFLNSFLCYFKANENNPIWLKVVMSGNLLYCLVTTVILIQYWELLKPLGIGYFILEFLVIFFVIFVEFRVLQGFKKNS